MLGSLTPSASSSVGIVHTGLPLLAKESSDPALTSLASALAPHLEFCLRNNVALANEDRILVSKEMTSSKPAIRRAFCTLAGDALWAAAVVEGRGTNTAETISFVQALLPAFDTNLKTVAANPMGAVAGPLEGYIALAILLGPLSRIDKFG